MSARKEPPTLGHCCLRAPRGHKRPNLLAGLLIALLVTGPPGVNPRESTPRRMHELVSRTPGFISMKGYASDDGEESTSSASSPRTP